MLYRSSRFLCSTVLNRSVSSAVSNETSQNATPIAPRRTLRENESSSQTKKAFLEQFRSKLNNDTTGKNQLEDFLELPEHLPPSAASIGPLKRGSEPLPPWLKFKVPKGFTHQPRFNQLRRSMREKKLSTVCEEAKCPNIGECWGGEDNTDNNNNNNNSTATATIMLMGSHCTRGCRFCSVLTSKNPPPLDVNEPEKVAAAISEMGVGYIVLTMVDRDDLPDGGVHHVVKCIETIKKKNPTVLLEALVGDFHGDLSLIEQVAHTPLSVYAHNIECVERVSKHVRDRRASYRQSLATLEHARKCTDGKLLTKSSIMLGLGETEEEVRQALKDLRTAGVSAVTLGQYLQPSRTRLKVSRYAHPKEFEMWEKEALEMGFVYCASGPMVRSSYRAGEFFLKKYLNQHKEPKEEATSS